MDKVVQKRSANWGEGERSLAVELILCKADIIFGKFRGASQGAKEKERAWQDIADQLNASGQASCLRTPLEMKKMFGNVKSRAKEKYDNNKKTGGGPAISLSPTEELIINHLLMNNKSQMTGLEGGVDSLIPSSTNQVSQLLPQSKHVTAANKETTCITFQEVFEGDNVIDSNNTTAVTAPIIDCTGDACTETSENETGRKHFLYFSNTKKNKTGKRKQDDKEDDFYALEKKRICKEIDLLEQRKAQEHELFLLQKRIFLKQLDEYTE